MKAFTWIALVGAVTYVTGGVLTYCVTGHVKDAVFWPLMWLILILAGLAFKQ